MVLLLLVTCVPLSCIASALFLGAASISEEPRVKEATSVQPSAPSATENGAPRDAVPPGERTTKEK